jgi:proline iminopeptidase
VFPLYPEIKPYSRHRLAVDHLHELYVDESGTLDGIPVVFVHDGPGSGCEFDSRCFFSPEKYRIVLFDQRGAGRSTPHGELRENNTSKLIMDMEKIRELLGIERWVVFGGGWGAALSLAYAEMFPDRVLGLILRGVSLGRRQDREWFLNGARRFFPDHWEDLVHPIPEAERGDLVEAFYQRMTGDDELARMGAAKAWSMWEAHCSTLHPNQRLLSHFSNTHRAIARCRLGTHYFRHDCFLDNDQLLRDIDKIREIPGIIVHGRFDTVSPIENAYALHRAWHHSQLYIVREACHSATEPPIIDALVRATRDMALRFEADFDV